MVTVIVVPLTCQETILNLKERHRIRPWYCKESILQISYFSRSRFSQSDNLIAMKLGDTELFAKYTSQQPGLLYHTE